MTSLGSFNDHIAAGDQISSVSLLKVKDDKLISEARDYGPLYPVAVEALSDTNIIASNVRFPPYRPNVILSLATAGYTQHHRLRSWQATARRSTRDYRVLPYGGHGNKILAWYVFSFGQSY